MSCTIVRRSSLTRLVAIGLALLTATAARACFVCLELPEATLADRVWSADAVVHARPAAANPFVFEVAEILHGSPQGAIPFLVDSAARAAMARDPDLHALVLQQPDGSWERGPTGGEAIKDLVVRMLALEVTWSDEVDDPDRARAFLALHAHDDPMIRDVALQELARLPYARLRQIEVALSTDWLLRRLADRGSFALRPLLVRLLGLHPDPAAQAFIRERALLMPAASREDWLVALIEIDGADAIERIIAISSKDDDRHAAVKALVAHSEPARTVTPAVASALRELAQASPALAANALVGLDALGDYTLAPQVSEMLMQGSVADPATAFRLMSYLAAAMADEDQPPLHALPALR